jgi:hypothetical protein
MFWREKRPPAPKVTNSNDSGDADARGVRTNRRTACSISLLTEVPVSEARRFNCEQTVVEGNRRPYDADHTMAASVHHLRFRGLFRSAVHAPRSVPSLRACGPARRGRVVPLPERVLFRTPRRGLFDRCRRDLAIETDDARGIEDIRVLHDFNWHAGAHAQRWRAASRASGADRPQNRPEVVPYRIFGKRADGTALMRAVLCGMTRRKPGCLERN